MRSLARPPELVDSVGRRELLPILSVRRGVRTACSSSSTKAATVQLEVEQKEGPKVTISGNSGSILRTTLLENKLEVYSPWNKVWQCGGVGQCGTCIVEILEGSEMLSERTNTEIKKLKKKPASYRLACQTVVGDGENSGTIKLRTRPA